MSTYCWNMLLLTFTLQIISSWAMSEANYSLHCPVQSHWRHRANFKCSYNGSYFCVYDENKRYFIEFCHKNAIIEKKGYKVIFRGSIDGDPCENNLYQPFKFNSSGNSGCVYKKSVCTEEGQVIYRNGTSQTDTICRCDDLKGYAFIHRPHHRCYCVPSKEDCSCYFKKCSPDEFLSQDYECLKMWKQNADCSVTIDGTLDTSAVISTDGYITKEGTTESFSMPALIVTLLVVLSIAVRAYMFSVSSNSKYVQNELSRNSLPEQKDEVQIGKIGLIKHETTCIIPQDVLDEQTEEIMKWKKTHVHFEETTASKRILDEMKTHGFVILSGPPGCGKSAIAYNTAFMLEKIAKFKILPISSPKEIRKYLLPETKQIFVIDDPVGRYDVDETNIRRWKNEENFIKETFTNSLNTKLILTCRSYIYKSGFSRLLHVPSIHSDLLSSNLKLSLGERTKLCKRYNLPDLNEDTIMLYDFFPLLCAMNSTQEDTSMFFVNPYKILNKEIGNMKEHSDIAFLAIALLVVQDDNIAKQSLSLENETIKELLNDLCNESGCKYFPSTTVLLSTLYNLIGTYIKETEHGFACIHDTLFLNLSFIVGSSIIHCLIKYGSSKFLANRLQLASLQEEHDELVIIVKPEQEEIYFQRLLSDIKEGYHRHVFTGIQIKNPLFRSKLHKCLKSLKDIDVTCDDNNSTPLHIVSEQGYDDLVFTLYQIKKDQINHQNNSKRTPLFMACLGGHDKVIQTILGIYMYKSSLHIADREDLMPLDAASLNDHSSTVTLLLQNGAKINRKDNKSKRTALQRACESGSTKVVSSLLTHKPDMKNTDLDGLKAIHIACKRGYLYIVELLLNHEDMTNECDAHGRTPLFIACESNQPNIVCMLLEKKANVNQTDVRKNSPIHKACQIGNDNIVRVLLDNFAKVNIKSDNGYSPLHVASMKGELKCVEILLDNNAEIDLTTEQGWTAFFLSCSKGQLDICRLLHVNGANVNVCDKSGNTPLHVACREKHERIVRFLIDHDANVNAVNRQKESPLYIACMTELFYIVQLLINNYAAVNFCEEKDNSPLHVVCFKENKRIVQLLLDHKANIHKRNKAGKTPFDIVQEKKNDTIVDMFNRS